MRANLLSGIYHADGCGWGRSLTEVDSLEGLRPCHRCSADRPDPVVYFARVETRRGAEAIKIGYSHDLRRRVAQLADDYRSIDVLATIPGGQPREAEIHRMFASARIGKWELFRETEDLLAFIAAQDAA